MRPWQRLILCIDIDIKRVCKSEIQIKANYI